MFAAIAAVANGQHGLVRLDQARAQGATTAWLDHQGKAGRLRRRAPCVYALAGAPETRVQDLLVHVFAAGPTAYATGDSALALWTPEIELPDCHDIVVPRHRSYRAPGVRVRRSRDIDLAVPGVRDGVPVVGVARALLDVAVDVPVEELVRRIDSCRRHLPMSVGALLHALRTHEGKGRPGVAVYRAALRRLTGTVPDSEFERLVLRDLQRRGIARPRLHHVVWIPGEQPIELDLDWEDVLVDVELDGADHVVRMRRARRDRQRDRLLQSVGYTVLRYTWDDYVEDRDAMLDEIARFLA